MDNFATLAGAIGPSFRVWIFALAFMTALELLLAKGAQPFRARLAGLLFWAIWLPATALTFAVFHTIWDLLGIAPLFTLPLTMSWTGWLAIVLAPLAGAAVGDFFFYWFHRAQHAWFWRYHAVHHSIRDLSAVNAYHHISEGAIQSLLFLVPSSLIVADTGPFVPAMAMILYFQASFIHSPVRVNFGPLRSLFVDNRFHRIHHSLEERHFDRNFGAFTTLWDRLFGTAHFPKAEEWPDVGLAEIDQPRNVGQWLSLPLRYGRQPDADRPAAEEVAAR